MLSFLIYRVKDKFMSNVKTLNLAFYYKKKKKHSCQVRDGGHGDEREMSHVFMFL